MPKFSTEGHPLFDDDEEEEVEDDPRWEHSLSRYEIAELAAQLDLPLPHSFSSVAGIINYVKNREVEYQALDTDHAQKASALLQEVFARDAVISYLEDRCETGVVTISKLERVIEDLRAHLAHPPGRSS